MEAHKETRNKKCTSQIHSLEEKRGKMSKRDIVICLIAIVILLVLIVDKLEKDDLMDKLSTEHIELYNVVASNEVAIVKLQAEKDAINRKLEEWSTIDMKWIYWIEKNWHLFKQIGGDDGR